MAFKITIGSKSNSDLSQIQWQFEEPHQFKMIKRWSLVLLHDCGALNVLVCLEGSSWNYGSGVRCI
jgi:hypothetical protein